MIYYATCQNDLTKIQTRTCLSYLRKRKTIKIPTSSWIPAFAGMTTF